ncbi:MULTISPECIES: glycosyltransferase family 2 protein [Parabacteroides]|jgi:putative transferase|uniref:glycosyltransferase family 2 protein n=1 Tax=Parabacteroides TaxID=375288 RepID=UPI000EFF6AFC|nr:MULTISPECIES: glycosyltransferase family 2 protein [Parabacteroides]RKU69417.1 glycosyltransferase family 2 protein [Parabacteroides sp. AF17-3]
MLDISVIILTYNEEKHIRRCIENVISFAKEVFIIDSFSTDRTLEIAREYHNVHILQNKWENNYAKQFNWGLEHSDITTQWVLRLDADEYLLPELIQELYEKLPSLTPDITGVLFNRRYIFMEKWIKGGIYPTKLLRLFRSGKGICEQRLMDEHIQLLEGYAVEFKYDMVDKNLNDLSWTLHKQVNYAIREAIDLLDIEINLTGTRRMDKDKYIGKQAYFKRMKKHKYVCLPLFWRAFAFFCYRYILHGGFKDGKIGFLFHFMYSWWYRMLVDAKILEIRKACGRDKEKIREHILTNYNIDIDFI